MSAGSAAIAVKVVPRASKNEIVGWEGEALKVRLTAPPVEGKANAALVKLLAEKIGVSRAQIEVVTGSASRRKLVRVRGISSQQIRDLLG